VKVLAIVHQQGAGLGILPAVAAARGVELERWDIFAAAASPPALDDYAGVVLFGGDMHADDDAGHTWLELERRLVRQCLADARPLLGICFGAQLLAHVTDGVVRPAREPELGWREVTLTSEATADELFSALPTRLIALEWHIDEFETPSSHVTLARSAACEQAFRVGEAAWGVQFNPDFTAQSVAKLLDGESSRAGSLVREDELARIREETRRNLGEWNAVGHALLDRFTGIAESRC
jgi:GMP synthase (glutamine-hydrolysing)